MLLTEFGKSLIYEYFDLLPLTQAASILYAKIPPRLLCLDVSISHLSAVTREQLNKLEAFFSLLHSAKYRREGR